MILMWVLKVRLSCAQFKIEFREARAYASGDGWTMFLPEAVSPADSACAHIVVG